MSNPVINQLPGFSIGAVLVGAISWVITHPDLVEKWEALIFGWLSRINSRYKYRAASKDIQSKVNSYVNKLSNDLGIAPVRVRLKWINRQSHEDEIQLEDNEVVIVIRDRGYKNKNFVHAAYFYTSTTLLPQTKVYLSKKQGESLDLYTTKNVIEYSNRHALEIFMSDFFRPLMEDSKIQALVMQFIQIDKSGMYSHVLLQELTYLGSKTFLSQQSNAIREEVSSLIAFLESRAVRDIGDTSKSEEFIGKYCRCAVKIVSTSQVRHENKTEVPSKRILHAFRAGIDNVYVLGPYKDQGKTFIKNVCSLVIEQEPSVEIAREDDFINTISVDGAEKDNHTYFAHLTKASQAKYLIEDSMIKDVERLSS
jgi:coenzyme F420-reducing hydrogenase delta subunit